MVRAKVTGMARATTPDSRRPRVNPISRVTDTTATSFPSSGLVDLRDTAAAQIGVKDASDSACTCVSDLAAAFKRDKVQLVWSDTGAHLYGVYRGTTAGGPYDLIATTDSRFSTYVDFGLPVGTYYYVVRELAPNGDALCQSPEIAASASGRSRNRAPVIVSTPEL